MKKMSIIPKVREFFEPKEYGGWAVNTSWAAVRLYKKGSDAPTGRDPLPWTLYHVPTACWVAGFKKREHAQVMADALDAIGDWSEGIPTSLTSDDIDKAMSMARAKIAVLEAEGVLVREQKRAAATTET